LSTDASLPTAARVPALGRPRSRLRFPRGRSDDALVARVRAGDERAFELVFDRYHRGLLAFCRRMLASDEEAEDGLQHTFMAAYGALRSSERPILKAWL
jgi:DNA-directed RNA polymerase specialized sigma24 family protein